MPGQKSGLVSRLAMWIGPVSCREIYVDMNDGGLIDMHGLEVNVSTASASKVVFIQSRHLYNASFLVSTVYALKRLMVIQAQKATNGD